MQFDLRAQLRVSARSLRVLSGVRGYGRGAAETKEGGLKRLLGAIPALFLVVLVLGGILGGVFTATEASAIAVLYSLLLTVVIERSLSLRELPQLFVVRLRHLVVVVAVQLGCICVAETGHGEQFGTMHAAHKAAQKSRILERELAMTHTS